MPHNKKGIIVVEITVFCANIIFLKIQNKGGGVEKKNTCNNVYLGVMLELNENQNCNYLANSYAQTIRNISRNIHQSNN